MVQKAKLAVAILFCSTAIAGGPIPSINDAPIFQSIVGPDPQYHTAAAKAQEAFFLQIGLTQQIDQANGLINAYITKESTKAATYVINNYTPFQPKHVFFVMGAAYAIGVKKQVTQSFRNPLYRPMTNTISVGQDGGSLTFNIPF